MRRLAMRFRGLLRGARRQYAQNAQNAESVRPFAIDSSRRVVQNFVD
jgi:hypothetical protein